MTPSHPVPYSHLLTGSLLWIASVQYLVVEFLAQRAWYPQPYSLRFNTISDLGVTICTTMPLFGVFGCSPLHLLMNVSFMLSGALTLAGLYLLRDAFPKHWTVQAGMLLIAIGAVGSVGVGLFPENENLVLHLVSALTFFLLSNMGLLLLGTALRFLDWRPKYARYTAILGATGLVSFLLLPLGLVPFIGVGVLERLVAYPVTVWVIASGILMLRNARGIEGTKPQ